MTKKNIIKLFIAIFISISILFAFSDTSNTSDASPNTRDTNYTQQTKNKSIVKIAYADELTDNIQQSENLISKNLKEGGDEPWILSLWNFCLSLVNIFLIGVLIYLGVVNILHINYDTYQIKKFLVPLIIFVVLANFSLFICRAIGDFSSALSGEFIGDPAKLEEGLKVGLGLSTKAEDVSGWIYGLANTKAEGLSGTLNMVAYAGRVIIGIIVSLIASLIIFILSILLYVRIYVVYILAALSPLAFFGFVLPATQGYSRKWFDWFLRFVFMGPIIALVLRVASIIGETSQSGGSVSGWGGIVAFIIVLALIIIAIGVPFAIMGMIFTVPGFKQLGDFAKNRATSFYKQNKFLRGWAGRLTGGGKRLEAEAAKHENLMALRTADEQEQGIGGWAKGKIKNIKDKGFIQGGLKESGYDYSRYSSAKRQEFAKDYKERVTNAEDAKKLIGKLGSTKETAEIEAILNVSSGYLDQSLINEANDLLQKNKSISTQERDALLTDAIKSRWQDDIQKGKALTQIQNPSGNNADLSKFVMDNLERYGNNKEAQEKALKNSKGVLLSAANSSHNDTSSRNARDFLNTNKGKFDSAFQTKIDEANELTKGIDKMSNEVANHLSSGRFASLSALEADARSATSSTSRQSQKHLAQIKNMQNGFRKTVSTDINIDNVDKGTRKQHIQNIGHAMKAMSDSGITYTGGVALDPTNELHREHFFNEMKRRGHFTTAQTDELRDKFKENYDKFKPNDIRAIKQIIKS